MSRAKNVFAVPDNPGGTVPTCMRHACGFAIRFLAAFLVLPLSNAYSASPESPSLTLLAKMKAGFFQVSVFNNPDECQEPGWWKRLSRSGKPTIRDLRVGETALSVVFNRQIITPLKLLAPPGSVQSPDVFAVDFLFKFNVEPDTHYKLDMEADGDVVSAKIFEVDRNGATLAVVPTRTYQRQLTMTGGGAPRVVKSCTGNQLVQP